MNYPWHEEALRRVLAGRANLHHALLVEGNAGIGKRGFALALAAALLCEASAADGRACGKCQGCRWFAQGSHPDFRQVRPEIDDPDFVAARDRRPSRHIRIEQIRALADFTAIGTHRDGRKIILVDPAEAMNVVAANALLKTLEEPPGRTNFLLVCARPDVLPATVRSRCRSLHLPAPPTASARDWLAAQARFDAQEAERWLALAGGAPLHALRFAEPAQAAACRAALETLAGIPDIAVADAAEKLYRLDAHMWLPIVRSWASDLARVLGGAAPRFLPRERAQFDALRKRTSLAQVLRLEADLAQAAAAAEQPLNPRLLAEGIVLRCCEAFEA